jgi:hypothetical protein
VNVGPIHILGIVAVLFVAVAIGITAWAVIPIGVILIAALFAAPIAAMMKKADVGRGTEPGGVPDTDEAAYEPAVKPDEQAASH